jgi:hypothetical protein
MADLPDELYGGARPKERSEQDDVLPSVANQHEAAKRTDRLSDIVEDISWYISNGAIMGFLLTHLLPLMRDTTRGIVLSVGYHSRNPKASESNVPQHPDLVSVCLEDDGVVVDGESEIQGSWGLRNHS